MASNSPQIFLLTPVKDKNTKKIIWANSIDDARKAVDVHLLKHIEPGDKIPLISDGIYSDSTTLCEEISSAITDVEQFDNTIHFKYMGTQIHLGKGKAEFLEKFFDDN